MFKFEQETFRKGLIYATYSGPAPAPARYLLQQLIVVEKRNSFGLLQKLKSDNCLPGTAPLGRVPFLLEKRVRLWLHDDIDLLKSEVYGKIREMAAFSDGILLFYCSCGEAFESLEEDFSGFECPLYCLKDGNREIVADCISAALGGNTAYSETIYRPSGGLAPSTSRHVGLELERVERRKEEIPEFQQRFPEGPKKLTSCKNRYRPFIQP
ncbi:hypothetical protein MSWHS_2259 [Methanosarcina sp. WWM596]|nr:hypothetical protein MSWHS_2259 [Methanosarcina sp. WWM596]AKB23048.1 hypothetical protein MSWH1_2777 [Methanosarcina sp. WH1]